MFQKYLITEKFALRSFAQEKIHVAELQNYFFYCHRVSKSRFNASRSSKITTLTTSRSILDAKQHSKHLKNAFLTPPSSTLKPCQSSNYPGAAKESHSTFLGFGRPEAQKPKPGLDALRQKVSFQF